MILVKICSYICSKVKSNDFYTKQITFSYNQEDGFKTILGGVVSIAIKLILFVYALALISVIINRSDTKRSVNTTVKNLALDDTKYYIGKGTFAIAFMMNDGGNNLLMDPQYFEISFYNGFYHRAPENGSISANFTSIPYDY